MPDIIVAGHICLDITPNLSRLRPDILAHSSSILGFEVGRVLEIGDARFSIGGHVANVGQVLLKLGMSTGLMTQVGGDIFGDVVRGLLNRKNSKAAETLHVAGHANTAYSLILGMSSMDVTNLYYSGCNDLFSFDDIELGVVALGKIFCFGYPALMAKFYEDGGESLTAMFRSVKELGVTTVLNMSMPDPTSKAAGIDWQVVLEKCLPYVDIFVTSVEEILFMLNPKAYVGGTWRTQRSPANFYGALSQEILDFGAGMVLLQLGDNGLYLRTAGAERLMRLGAARPESLGNWSDRELWIPVFRVTVRNTRGSEDATLAGFMTALLRDFDPAGAISVATAVGASSIESEDGVNGVMLWSDLLSRLQGTRNSWQRSRTKVTNNQWQPYQHGSFRGPHDGIHAEGGAFD